MSELSSDIHYREGYLDPSPYPEVAVTGPNKCYARLLMEDYAGGVSEFTAINQYLYHHAVSSEEADVAQMLEKVSIVEMMHMEKLAKAIELLGEKPVFQAGPDRKDWTSAFVTYGTSLCDRLHADIASEYAAIHNYQEHIRQISDPQIQALLKRIILDEQVHIKLFKQAIAKYGC